MTKINYTPEFDAHQAVELKIDRPKVTIGDLIEIVNFAYESNIPGYWEVEYSNVKKAELTLGTFSHNYTYSFTIKDFSTSEEGVEHTVDVGTIKRGIELILTGKTKVAHRIVDDIRTNIAENELPAIDSDAVDVIIQAGLFEELVYG